MNFIKNITIAASLLVMASANAIVINTYLIDDFSDDQALISATVGNTASSSVLGTNILGGERDLLVTNYDGQFASNSASVVVENGNLAFSANSTVTASFIMQWDGIDGSSAINTNGLADGNGQGVDFTEGLAQMAFQTDTIFADFDYFFDVSFWWANGTQTITKTLAGPGHSDYNNPYIAFLPFAVFDTVDFTDISAVQIEGNSAAPLGALDRFGNEILEGSRVAAFDVSIDQVTTTAVPEPGTLFLFAFGAIGLAVASSKRKSV